MIRRLNSKDHQQVMNLLAPEAAFNIFIIGDIENFGYQQDFMELWGDFCASNDLQGVLLRFYSSFTAYAPQQFDVASFVSIMKGYKWKGMSGKRAVIEQFLPYLAESARARVTHFTELTTLCTDTQPELPAGYQLHKADIARVDELVDLSRACFGSTVSDSLRESLRRELEQGVGTIWYAENQGKIVSKAQTTAENSLSAMVIGVCTDVAHRGLGLASACTHALCAEHLAKGRRLCLFWDNPTAGRIYERMGFHSIGEWTMIEHVTS